MKEFSAYSKEYLKQNNNIIYVLKKGTFIVLKYWNLFAFIVNVRILINWALMMTVDEEAIAVIFSLVPFIIFFNGVSIIISSLVASIIHRL